MWVVRVCVCVCAVGGGVCVCVCVCVCVQWGWIECVYTVLKLCRIWNAWVGISISYDVRY